MWFPHRLAVCGSVGNLSHLQFGPQTHEEENENTEDEDHNDRDLEHFSVSSHKSTSSGSCTSNYHSGAMGGYQYPMYPSHGYYNTYPNGGMVGLQKSASCSYMSQPGYYCYPSFYQQPLLEDSEDGSIARGTIYPPMEIQEHSPDPDQKDISPQPSKESDELASRINKKYSEASLRPDSSLPPVIRRRNSNRRKMLAVSVSVTCLYLLLKRECISNI